MMEVYAAALAYSDYNIGRVVQAVKDSGQLDNTIVIYEMGDNGASAEGTMQGTTNEVATAANGVTESLPYLLSQYNELGGPHTYNRRFAEVAGRFDHTFAGRHPADGLGRSFDEPRRKHLAGIGAARGISMDLGSRHCASRESRRRTKMKWVQAGACTHSRNVC
jgi:arylsulfatase A-like enzyme